MIQACGVHQPPVCARVCRCVCLCVSVSPCWARLQLQGSLPLKMGARRRSQLQCAPAAVQPLELRAATPHCRMRACADRGRGQFTRQHAVVDHAYAHACCIAASLAAMTLPVCRVLPVAVLSGSTCKRQHPAELAAAFAGRAPVTPLPNLA